jgi:hypothetical protein
VGEGVREPSELRSAVNGVFVREVPLAAAAWASSFGTILCGLETMRSAWSTLEHVFPVRVGSSAQGAAPCPSQVSCSLDHVTRSDS